MFALRDALYVTSDAWGKEELHGIPWQCGGDAVFTPAVPVAQECTVHFRLRSMGLPAGVGAAHVWIKQGAAEFSHVGTLASASSRFAMKMEVPQVRIAILPCAGADAPRVPPTPAQLGEAAPDSVASLLAEPMEVTKNESGLWDDDDDAEELPSLDVLRARQQVAAAAARPPPPPPLRRRHLPLPPPPHPRTSSARRAAPTCASARRPTPPSSSPARRAPPPTRRGASGTSRSGRASRRSRCATSCSRGSRRRTGGTSRPSSTSSAPSPPSASSSTSSACSATAA